MDITGAASVTTGTAPTDIVVANFTLTSTSATPESVSLPYTIDLVLTHDGIPSSVIALSQTFSGSVSTTSTSLSSTSLSVSPTSVTVGDTVFSVAFKSVTTPSTVSSTPGALNVTVSEKPAVVIPEIDPSSMFSALTLLSGGVLWLNDRRRRRV
jgi:hypothetical protein